MNKLQPLTFDAAKARQEWNDFDHLLKTRPTLEENKDVLPFFKNRHNLAWLMSYYFPLLIDADVVAHEFPIGGNFKADFIVGDSKRHNYVLVEFENGNAHSIFKKQGKRAISEWSPRLEAAFSQLADWLYILDDARQTAQFKSVFGDQLASFQGLIVLGKDVSHSQSEEARLRWREDHLMLDSNKVNIRTFNDLLANCDSWLKKYYNS